jgi:phage-related protein
MTMKSLKFLGSSLDDLRNFPEEARRAAGFELHAVQSGFEPSDWKPVAAVGPGVTRNPNPRFGRVASNVCRQIP